MLSVERKRSNNGVKKVLFIQCLSGVQYQTKSQKPPNMEEVYLCFCLCPTLRFFHLFQFMLQHYIFGTASRYVASVLIYFSVISHVYSQRLRVCHPEGWT